MPALIAVAPAQARRGHRLHLMPQHADPIRSVAKRARRPLARASAFATTWGCDEKSADLDHLLSNAPQVKFVYAYPNGSTDQLTSGPAYGDVIQADGAALANRV